MHDCNFEKEIYEITSTTHDSIIVFRVIMQHVHHEKEIQQSQSTSMIPYLHTLYILSMIHNEYYCINTPSYKEYLTTPATSLYKYGRSVGYTRKNSRPKLQKVPTIPIVTTSPALAEPPVVTKPNSKPLSNRSKENPYKLSAVNNQNR